MLNLPDDLLHLHSPAHLAMADTITLPEDKKWKPYPHLMKINDYLLDVATGKVNRLFINLPAQCGKSWLTSVYFPAWMMLVFPETRIIVVGYNEEFAVNRFGAMIKEVVEKWGSLTGVTIRSDSKSKEFWRTECNGQSIGHVKSTGFGGSAAGIAADLFVFDDLVKGEEEARLPDRMEKLWDFCEATIVNRLRRESKLVGVGTRWSKYDPFGKFYKKYEITGEPYVKIVLPALAMEDDPLGRKPGEALCEELKSRVELENERKSGSRWFNACRQQIPIEEEGLYFTPSKWPEWTDLGDAVSIPNGSGRTIYMKSDITTICAVDWAASDKKHSDYTAIAVFGLLPNGGLIIYEIYNRRLKIENCVPFLAEVCRKWRPLHVGVESVGFQGSFALEVRRYPDIPEPWRMKHGNQSKNSRARYAMLMGQEGRIYWPTKDYQRTLKFEQMHSLTWIEVAMDQLQGFTGDGHERDDIVDAIAYCCQMAQTLRGTSPKVEMPVMLQPGRETVFGR